MFNYPKARLRTGIVEENGPQRAQRRGNGPLRAQRGVGEENLREMKIVSRTLRLG
jgi:hypothetical protein